MPDPKTRKRDSVPGASSSESGRAETKKLRGKALLVAVLWGYAHETDARFKEQAKRAKGKRTHKMDYTAGMVHGLCKAIDVIEARCRRVETR